MEKIWTRIRLGFGWSDLYEQHDEPNNGDGLGDLSIVAKWNLFQSDDERYFLSYVPGLVMPTGDDDSDDELGPGQGFWSFADMLAFTAIWNELNLNIDLGYDLPFGEKRGDNRGTMVLDLAPGYQVTSWLQPEVELNYEHGFELGEADADILNITAGTILNLTDCVRLDLGISQSIYGRNAGQHTALITNASWTW